MQAYTVTWTIEVEAADPRQAAQAALAIQRDPQSTATVFRVEPFPHEAETVDLSD